MHPREHGTWIRDMLQNLIQRDQGEFTVQVLLEEIGLKGFHARRFSGMFSGPYIRVQGCSLPTGRFHRSRKDRQIPPQYPIRSWEVQGHIPANKD